MKCVIEFRSGSYFTNPSNKRGGPIGRAMVFYNENAAREYVNSEVPWVWFNGGMIKAVKLELKVGILPAWQGEHLIGASDGDAIDEIAANDWLHNHYRGYVVDRSRPQPCSGRWWLKKVSP